MRTVATILAAAFLFGASAAAADCGYESTGEAAASRVFPRDDVFRPLVADPKEPRFYASYQRIDFRTGNVRDGQKRLLHSGFVAAGESIGLWTRRREDCDGVQVSLFGGVYSQFDLSISSGDLINTDFLVGIPVTWRRGPWSVRGRLLHQSSHLGDELLIRNPGIRVKNFGFEMLDALVSYDHGPWRGYGGLGVVFNSSTDFDPMAFQAGIEARSGWNPAWRVLGLQPTPVFGVDYKTWQQQDWGSTWNVVTGLEFHRPGETTRIRFLGTMLAGHYPFAQFFDETRVRSLGLTLQLEL